MQTLQQITIASTYNPVGEPKVQEKIELCLPKSACCQPWSCLS